MTSTPGRSRNHAHKVVRRLLPWLLGIVLYAAVYMTALALTWRDSPWNALRWTIANVLPEILLAPFVIAMTRRLPWGVVSSVRFVAVHVVGAFVFMIGVVALWFGIGRMFANGDPNVEASLMMWKAIMTLLVFAALCGIGQAIAFAERARDAAAAAARAQTLQVEAQLAALRAQLNPHFVMNLLHSLVGVVERDPALAARMLERLGDTLRYVVRVQRQDADLVTLRDEWSFVRDYLSLEGSRLRDRLRADLRADEAVLDVPIPPFVVQPLVENAIRHAIAPRAEGGRVGVHIERAGEMVRIRVEDDGPGEMANPPTRGAGVGMRLVRERLQALYGDRAQFATGRSPLGGFLAEVVLPVHFDARGGGA